ncbi:Lrp/AsnC family transcriptional regulator [Novosphingobium sp. MMS21-SN21R]|uniref:Lrp/AsnC family transcriptional regulator n=1 Tax=Novosphingobium sp. MMS21-SN21R TaxID=2969298 RepID=UPI0028851A62|nr:Lrp/AsnC family transcriptional regulator [Novosphingobium sp. MMS21-SN21R]MDT0508548.1 Lrp/AsnC family transcriptional regulator [Novosphingobium sp. MMS21-SN21R]
MTFSNSDKKILRILQADGRMPNVALAEQIGMSPSPCLRRLKQLEDDGVISRYAAILDREKLGLGIMAFVEVKVPQIAETSIVDLFKDAVRREPSIIGCHLTAGQFDFLLTVVAQDMTAYSALAQNVLLRLPGVQDMRSSFVLEAIKDTTMLPIA